MKKLDLDLENDIVSITTDEPVVMITLLCMWIESWNIKCTLKNKDKVTMIHLKILLLE